jgi:antitoxin component of RelBE/YafQ-DinJ toxin-antitoxin module
MRMALKSMAKEKIINFRIDADLKNRARKMAEADGRSLSNWITMLIEKEVKRGRKKD